MELKELAAFAAEYTQTSQGNIIQPAWALEERLCGLRIYDTPLVAVAAAQDPLFTAYKNPEAVGPQMLLPEEWLPGARAVLSFFLPFSEEVRSSNRKGNDTSALWLHGRIEGQQYVAELSAALAALFHEQGAEAVVPAIDPRFKGVQNEAEEIFTSNWSERHAAYAAGLGTFGMSKGLITRRGMAGRFGSVITTMELEPTPRDYTGLYDYCSRCMACVARCPVKAIDEAGKHHLPCSRWMQVTAERYAPRYGCGKCQVGVPCETRNPCG